MSNRPPTIVVWTDHALAKAQLLGVARADVEDAVLADADGHVSGLEHWQASQRLPSDLLRMLPSPPVGVAG